MSSDFNNFSLTIKNYRCFPNEKPINISMRNGFTALVGVNNSGKSALLKFFYELRGLFTQAVNPNEFLTSIIKDRPFTPANTIRDNDEIFCNANNNDITIEISLETLIKPRDGIVPDKIVFTILKSQNIFRTQILHDSKYLEKDVNPNDITTVRNSFIKITDITIDMEAYYQIFKAISNTVYIGPFRNAINIGGHGNYYDMRIGEEFISLWDDYKSGASKAKNKAAIKLTQDIKSIFRFNSLEINADTTNQTLIVIVNDKPYKLEELGSGLAQFIIMLANIAIENPSWILIDEPELNLHPSLQIDFLTTLTYYASEGIIFATHNIGLARACAERIYSFRLDDEGRSEVKDFEAISSLSEFLGELSYSGYKDIGFGKVLLVEGPTEVKTVQQLLRKYKKDHKIVLLPLGGSSLIKAESETELNEIKRITTNIAALIDSEKEKADAPLPAERQAFVKTCQKVDIHCHVLERRALENYLSEKAIQTIKTEKYQSLGPYDKLADAPIGWSKQENWRIAREMTTEELKDTDLGKFLSSL